MLDPDRLLALAGRCARARITPWRRARQCERSFLLDWRDLRLELDRWAQASLCASFWWRDDDAAEPSPALARLLELAARHGRDLSLAILPATSTEALAQHLRAHPNVAVLQHGFAHRNHAARGERAVEVGGARPLDEVMDELRQGFQRTAELFGRRFRPVLAPPWNRIDEGIVAHLPSGGYRGVSAFGPRSAREPAPGILAANAHVDLLSWRGAPRFAGTAKVIGLLVDGMQARRAGRVDADEQIGILTHHRDHDAAAWDFLDKLLRLTGAHPAARWQSADEVFSLQVAT